MSVTELHPKKTVDDTYDARLANSLCDLESDICDLDRWAQIALKLSYDDTNRPGVPELLSQCVVEMVAKLTTELRRAFYSAIERTKAGERDD